MYIFGSHLLVCPVTKPADKRLNLAAMEVWLPEGRWTDIFSGRIYRGGQWVTMYRDLDAIPVLAPEGAIVPMYRNGENNDLSLEQPLEIHVWRGNGHYELYEDDGETRGYERGNYAVTSFEVQSSGEYVRFVISPSADSHGLLPESRQMSIHFRDIAAAQVYINGEAAQCAVSCITVLVSGAPVEIELRNILLLVQV